MTYARVRGYKKDDATKDIILVAFPIDEVGKPIEDGKDIEIRFSQDALQKLIRENLPTEEQRIQEVLDLIHKIRKDRSLNIEEIDKEIESLKDQAKKDFDSCAKIIDVKKVEGKFRTQISLLAQKRFITKFSFQEESELGLTVAKLRKAAAQKEQEQ